MTLIDSFQGNYRWLSNFWPAKVRWGIECSTVEHAYQAAKAESAKDRLMIARSPTPGAAKRLGKQVAQRSDWDSVKLQVMEYLLRQKFAAGSELAGKLIATDNAMIVEGNKWGDVFWGQCNGVGKNHLGELLMKIRGELQQYEQEKDS